ncbi:hypothetical protein ISP15_17865 [Dyella jejuensis]|uniref:Lipoprotein n=1 Tax=Dyella jejuensis TaxID=1432009 RepID=A0ABW8JP12_9GAMM
MKRMLFTWLSLSVLTGCNSERYYAASNPYAVDEPPTRYPLDFPLCYGTQGLVVAPLRIRLWGASFTDPVRLMWLRRQKPNEDGCYTDDQADRRLRVYVEKHDFFGDAGYYRGWMPLDKSGHRDFAASAYKIQLLNAKDLQKEKEKKQLDASTRMTNLAKLGFTYADVTRQDEHVTINGLVWRHRLTAMYEVTDPSHPTQGKLLEWRESYEHAVGDTHILRRQAHYYAMIVADPEWIAARRNLLLKLVQAIRIEPMTQAEVDAAVTQYQQQVQQDKLDLNRNH